MKSSVFVTTFKSEWIIQGLWYTANLLLVVFIYSHLDFPSEKCKNVPSGWSLHREWTVTKSKLLQQSQKYMFFHLTHSFLLSKPGFLLNHTADSSKGDVASSRGPRVGMRIDKILTIPIPYRFLLVDSIPYRFSYRFLFWLLRKSEAAVSCAGL